MHGSILPTESTQNWLFLCTCACPDVAVFDRKLELYDCCTSQTRLPTGVLRVPTEYLTMTMRKSAFIREKNSGFKRFY